jgi:hypothetical protein
MYELKTARLRTLIIPDNGNNIIWPCESVRRRVGPPEDAAIGRLAMRPISSSERLHTSGLGNLVCDLAAAEARDVRLLTCPTALHLTNTEPRRCRAQAAIGWQTRYHRGYGEVVGFTRMATDWEIRARKTLPKSQVYHCGPKWGARFCAGL